MNSFAKPLYLGILILVAEMTRQFGLGIDWGNEFHKSTMILPKKGFQMVENSISKRKTPSTLSFCGEDRFFESQAVIKFPRAACESFYMLNRFFETDKNSFTTDFSDTDKYFFEDLKVTFDKHSLVFESQSPVLKNFQRNSTIQTIDDFKGTVPVNYIRLEELFAMMLDIEKDNAFNTGQVEFKEAMFTIWDSSMSIAARKRLISSIHLGGLKPLGFVHENSAAAVYYAIDRKPENSTESENTLFVNIGSLGTKLSLIKFHSTNQTLISNQTLVLPTVSVVKDQYFHKFSGHLLDVCLGDFALSKQLKDFKRALKPNEITISKRRRLYNEVKRAKEMLTVNREVNFYVEDFFDDRHLNVKISKSEFEENCKIYFDELSNLLKSFINALKTDNVLINKVEILGGAVRVPRIQEIIKEVTQTTPASHINGDEGMAYGASFIAANFSAGIRTKKIILNDGPNYEIDLSVKFPENSNQTNKDTILFPFKTNYGTKKKMNIKKLQDDVKMILTQKNENYSIEYSVEGVQKALDRFQNKNVTDWKADFYFEIDHMGIPKLLNSDLQIKENVTEIVNKTLPKVNKTENDTTPPEVIQEIKYKLVVHTIKLTISSIKESYISLMDNKVAFEESKKLLSSIKNKELEKQRRSAIKNSLESFVYKLSSEAEDSASFLSEVEISKFKEKSEEIDNFIFSSEAESAEMSKFENLITDVDSLLSPLESRKDEFKNRESNWKNWNQFYKNMTTSIQDLKNNKPWISSENMTDTVKKLETSHKQVEEFYKQQLEMPLFSDPVFNRRVIAEKTRIVSNSVDKIRRIPKPKPEKTKDKTDKTIDDVLKNMKNNLTDTNFTKEQMEEMLQKMKDMKANIEEATKTAGESQMPEDEKNESQTSELSEEIPEVSNEADNDSLEARASNESDTIEKEAEISKEL
jgi:hypoxia up-regulated 1